jgi:Domain of unknown function (DUF4826)
VDISLHTTGYCRRGGQRIVIGQTIGVAAALSTLSSLVACSCVFTSSLVDRIELPAEAADAEEEQWCAAQRNVVTSYLDAEGLTHGEIGEWPARHIVPIVSIWVVESLARSGWIGWWVISGEVPTDYIRASTVLPPQHPRKALTIIAAAWLAQAHAAKQPSRAMHAPTGAIALTDELAVMLESRARLLQKSSADDALWEPE